MDAALPPARRARVRRCCGEEALSNRCAQWSFFEELGAAVSLPAVERSAIEALDDPGLGLAVDAAEALGKYGSPRVERALWRRLERFHAEWKDRVELLDLAFTSQDGAREAVRLQSYLVERDRNGPVVAVRRRGIEGAPEAAVGPAGRSNLEDWIREAEQDTLSLYVDWPDEYYWRSGNDIQYRLGRFSGSGLPALTQKLAQMPPGLHLILNLRETDRERHGADVDAIEKAARAARLDVTVK